MEKRNLRLKEFEDGIGKFTSRLERLENKSRKFSLYRLSIFLSGLTLFLLSFLFLTQLFVWLSLIITILIFGIVTAVHNKIDNGIKKCKIWIGIKKDSLARIKIDWQNIPAKDSSEKKDHPFNNDLSITGRNSLHQLVDISTSEEGRKKLEDWLLSINPSEETIIKRQKILKELIPLQHFRNKLILNSNLASGKRLEGTRLEGWLKSVSYVKNLKLILTILSVLIPVNVLLLIFFIVGWIPAYWSIGVLIYTGIYWFNNKYISELFERSLDIEMEFGKFSRVLEFLEKYNYSGKLLLREQCKTFFENNRSPSHYFKRLKRITTAVSFQKNPLTMLLLNIVFPYDFFFAYKLEKIKNELKDKLPIWLETFYNLEALVSLSNFAYINPDYVFPVIKNDSDNSFNTENIAHPFIPYEDRIPNNFSITTGSEIVIITGSNMSGKSTFLRSVGVNLVLAFAGGVVCASEFKTSLFRVYTCININDSVTDGISYFYAEVKRLKNLLDEIKQENSFPLFYLIDEIFRGTNNLERLIGSRSYIKTLAGLNGTGLISTHDLELIKLEDEIAKVSNYHFREDVSDGKMIFDYKLRKGPSPTTNALKIMKIEGLPVENT